MSHNDPLFNVIHGMFSFGITKPETARNIDEIREIIKLDKSIDLATVLDTLVKEGYVSTLENRFFLLGKGIVAVAAIFT